MKRILLIISLFILFLFVKPVYAQSDADWTIKNFDSQIIINQDTTVSVTETIDVDFGLLQKHGIYRNIPVDYSTNLGNKLNIRFKLISVTDEHGNYLSSKESKSGDNVNIRIGDPDISVSGENTYVIKYQIHRVLTKPDDNLEFYWNVTGTGWQVPIERASATVIVPGTILESTCFTGMYGSKLKECTANTVQNQTLVEAVGLEPNSGLTLAIRLNEQDYILPGLTQEMIWFFTDNWIYLLPLVVFLAMLILYLNKGRDKVYKNVFYEQYGVDNAPFFEGLNKISVYEPPKDLSPGEVGLLVDEKVHNRDITAIAIDLARRGYFTIKEISKDNIFKSVDFELTATGKSETELKDFEVSVLDMLFDSMREKGEIVKLSKLNKSAYIFRGKAVQNLNKHLTKSGFFTADPSKVRTMYLGLASLLGIVGFYLAIDFENVGLFICMALSAIIIGVFGYFMPARTAKGRKALEYVVGLKEYVRVGAYRQQKFENWGYFEKILPYTIAFGLTHKFINAFKDAKIPNPDWYNSQGTINVVNFSNAIDSFDSGVTTGVSATRPKSASSGGSGFGGGGSSGGGFGGGGGGSW